MSTDKSWWVPKRWLHEENLDRYITNEIRNIGVSCKDREVVRKLPAGDICACIDENKFFTEYVQSIKSNGGKFFVGSAVTSFDIADEYVEVITETGTVIRGRLVLDCSGADSIFVKRDNNLKHDFYWNVYGKLYKGVQNLGNTSFLIRCYRSLGGPHKGGKVFINDVPEGGSNYTPWLHFVSRRHFSVDEMRNMYKDIVNLPYLKGKLEDAEEVKEKFGWIPARDLKSRSRNRILSLGEAGGLVPFQSGMSFSFAIKTLERFVGRLQELLISGNLDRRSLASVTVLTEREELNFDSGKGIYSMLLNTTYEEFYELIDIFEVWGIESFSRTVLFLEEDLRVIQRLVRLGIKKFGLKGFKNILARDGLVDEMRIGSEILEDSQRLFLKNNVSDLAVTGFFFPKGIVL